MQDILGYCHGMTERSVDAGAVLLREGETTHVLYVLIEGRIEVLKGEFPVFATSEPGAVFGEISTLLDIPHTATVKTLAPSRIFVIEQARDFLRSRREITYHISTVLAQRLYKVTSYLVDLKQQFEDHADHLGMVDEVLGTLLHHQDETFDPGSDRYPDGKI